MSSISSLIQDYGFMLVIIMGFLIVIPNLYFDNEKVYTQILEKDLEDICFFLKEEKSNIAFQTEKNIYDSIVFKNMENCKDMIFFDETCEEDCLIEIKNGG